jgi:phenylalanyl-tRNA synthetase beta chain
LYGFDKIPMTPMNGDLRLSIPVKEAESYADLRKILAALGFHETISYSFIDKKLQTLLEPDVLYRELQNPITAEMSVMRTSLWGGLLQTLGYNKSRQQHRVKIFEIGACFHPEGKSLRQSTRLAGLIAGPSVPYQWGMEERAVDFFDLKGMVNNMLARVFPNLEINYQPSAQAALHPGQTAEIQLNGKKIGIIGALHPLLLQALDLKEQTYLFDIDLSLLPVEELKPAREISRFPEIRRDLAILVDQTIPAAVIQDTIEGSAGDWLKECFIFDVYQGQGIRPGLKSVALGMILQHPTRTLVDEEVVVLTDRVVQALKGQLGAELRS